MTPEAEAERTPSDVWVEQTLRLNLRYLVEVVERFGLCPWARATRIGEQLDRRVLLQTGVDVQPALDQLDQWSRTTAPAIGLLLFPRLSLSRNEFQRFAGGIIAEDRERCGTRSSPFALAAFHPEAEFDASNADRLVPFVRRTPDPTIQVVRISELERVRRDEVAGTQYVNLANFRLEDLRPPEKTLRQRISEHNLRTVQAARTDIEQVFNAIREDHRVTRAGLPELEDPLRP
jgi:hypothetical protein